MKKIISLLLLVLMVVAVAGCGKTVETDPPTAVNTVTTALKTYDEMSDGTFVCDGVTYQHRLEISGRMPNAAKDSTFIYLSNLEEITFEQAWKAAGFSSSTDDYFAPEDAVLVAWE